MIHKVTEKEIRRTGLKKETMLLLVVVLFWFAQYVYIPYQTPYLTAAGVTSGFLGTIVGAYGLTQVLFRLPIGVMADCAGKHKIFVLLGAVLAAGASLIRILVPDGNGFLTANLISGGASGMWISYMVLYSEYFKREEQQKATSKIIMACNLGMCLGFVFSTLLYGRTGMGFICAASVAAGLLGVAGTFFVQEDTRKTAAVDTHTIASCLKVCRNKRLILFAFLALLQQGIQMATAMSFTTQILKELGAAEGFIGAASVFYMLAAVSSAQFAATKTCAKRGAKFYVPLVFALTALYCILVPLMGNIYIIFVLQALPGMSTGILLSFLTSESMKEIPKEKSSTAMGLFQAVYAIGLSAFPAVAGVLKGFGGNQAAFGFLAGAAVLGTVISLVHYRR